MKSALESHGDVLFFRPPRFLRSARQNAAAHTDLALSRITLKCRCMKFSFIEKYMICLYVRVGDGLALIAIMI